MMQLALFNCQNNFNLTNGAFYEQIIQIQPFDNLAVEYNEVATLKLQDYFLGSLLQYKLSIKNLNKSIDFNQQIYQQMIRIREPIQNVVTESIQQPKTSQSSDPFPRSSVILEQNGGQQMSLFVLKKNFQFSRYEVSKYADGEVNHIYDIQLDTKIVNCSCTDMIVVKEQAVVLFCISAVLDEFSNVQSKVYATVQIDEILGKKPVVRYITYLQQSAYQDYRSGLRFVGYDGDWVRSHGVLFIGNRLNTVLSNPYVQQIIIRLNYTTFEEMKANNQTQRLLTKNPLWIKYQIVYDLDSQISNQQDNEVIDYGLFDQLTGTIGLLFKRKGLLLCMFGQQLQQEQSWILYPTILNCNQSNSQIFAKVNAISLYQNPLEQDKLYIAQGYPPGVNEIDITNPYNAFVVKTYSENQYWPNLYFESVGLTEVATNRNYVIQLMLKVETQEQVLRVYNRKSTRFNIILTDFVLPLYSRSTFFQFPNMFINILIFRDERRINVTAFYEYDLEISGTNSTLFLAFKQDVFEITVEVSNDYNSMNSTFYATYVDNNSTAVKTVVQNTDLQLFYNCGDDQFTYQLSDIFNGPNFDVAYAQSDADCAQGSCFFQLVNQNFGRRFQAEFNFSECSQAFIYSDMDYEKAQTDYTKEGKSDSQSGEKMVLLCVDRNSSIITSYLINLENQILQETNIVEIPMIQFKFFGYDDDDRSLFTLAQVINQNWMMRDKEIHYFQITDSRIQWKNYTNNFTDEYLASLFDSFDQIKLFTYNADINKGAIVANLNVSTEILIYYNMDFCLSQYAELGSEISTVTLQTSTKIVKVSSDNFIYTLSADNQLILHQVVNDETGSLIIPIRIQQIKDKMVVYDFDIYGGNYFLLYSDERTIEVYEILNEIQLTYKMTLPLYTDFVGFKFDFLLSNKRKSFQDTKTSGGGTFYDKSAMRSYYNGYFSVLLESEDFKGSPATYIFVYDLSQNQHNSYLMQINVTEMMLESHKRGIAMLGNSQHDTMSLVGDQSLRIYDMQYTNYLKMKDDSTTFAKLIKNCSEYKIDPNIQGNNYAVLIGNFKIKGISAFSVRDSNLFSSPVKIQIFTLNQGLAITSTAPEDERFTLAYANEEDSNITSIMLMQDYIEGFNLTYNTDCHYRDRDGQLQSCDIKNEKTIVDYTLNVPYSFYIEFVTNQRFVVQSFTLGTLYFIFDSMYYLNVLKLYDSTKNLDSIKGYPMQQIGGNLLPQQEVFGCNVTKPLNYIHLFYHQGGPNPFNLFLITYQCYIQDRLNFKIASVIVYDNNKNDDGSYFDIYQLDNSIPIPLEILDIEKGNITVKGNENDTIQTIIIIACEIPESFSNVLYIYNLSINLVTTDLQFKLLGYESAITQVRNTFKVSQMQAIPQTNLIILVDTTFGIYIYDLEFRIMLQQFDLQHDNLFSKQYQKLYGDLMVFNVFGDWPYSLHIITNYGIFIYSFQVNLLDREAIYPQVEMTLKPSQKRLIRSFFDSLNQEIAGNQYGYTFLMKKYTSRQSFDVYLAVVSFYSDSNSRILKMQKVSSNEECIALQEEYLISEKQKDQLAVSFICNTQMIIVKINMKPRIEVDLQKFSKEATKLIYDSDGTSQFVTDALEYNEFNLSISATNEYSQSNVNKLNVTVQVLYKNASTGKANTEFYIVGAFLLLVTTLLILFLNHGGNNGKSGQQYPEGQMEDRFPQQSFNYRYGSSAYQSVRKIDLQEVYINQKRRAKKQLSRDKRLFEIKPLLTTGRTSTEMDEQRIGRQSSHSSFDHKFQYEARDNLNSTAKFQNLEKSSSSKTAAFGVTSPRLFQLSKSDFKEF